MIKAILDYDLGIKKEKISTCKKRKKRLLLRKLPLQWKFFYFIYAFITRRHVNHYTESICNEQGTYSLTYSFLPHLLIYLSYFPLNQLLCCVLRAQPSIYNGAFLQKQLTTLSCKLLSQKISIVDVLLGSKHASFAHLLTYLLLTCHIKSTKILVQTIFKSYIKLRQNYFSNLGSVH